MKRVRYCTGIFLLASTQRRNYLYLHRIYHLHYHHHHFMKRFFFLLAFSLFFLNTNAQEIKSVESSFEDYLPLLKDAGFEMFSFDISSLKDETYKISFVTKEYVDGKLVFDSYRDDFLYVISNRTMLSEFPEDQQEQIIAENRAYDIEKSIYTLSKKISIGFAPAGADSLKKVRMIVENQGSSGQSLSLKPLNAPGFEGHYAYDIRPFKQDTIAIGDFTPLLLVGSFWYDEAHGIVRFCGENSFDKDMSSETLKLIPHYFVIGIRVEK